MMKKISFSIWLLVLSASIHAGGDCGTYLAKITWHSKSGNTGKGYINLNVHFYEPYGTQSMVFNPFNDEWKIDQQIGYQQLDISRVKNVDPTLHQTILAANRSLLYYQHFLDNVEHTDDPDMVSYADSIFEWQYTDTAGLISYTLMACNDEFSAGLDSFKYDTPVLLHYAHKQSLRFDTIYLITLDSLYWCSDFDQVQWVDEPAANLLLSVEAGSYCRFYRCDTEYWIDFICFDKAWSKNDVLQMIDFVKLDSILTEGNFNDIDLCFGSRLKKAIKGNKILYFVRSSP
jgi:hypothetical protein